MQQQLDVSNKSETREARDWQAQSQCERAKELQFAGDYEGARAALASLWQVIGDRPNIAHLQPETQAEVLLRTGVLAGAIGSARQIDGAQESAKDLLGESLRLFESISNTEKVAETQTELGVAYWRCGNFDEARILFRQAIANAIDPQNKLHALINATAEISSGGASEALVFLDEAALLLDLVPNHALKGRYHLQRALYHRNAGGPENLANLDRALIEYAAASFHLDQAGHTRYVARVENNTGYVLLKLQRYEAALTHLNNARGIFITLKDSGSVAQVNESRAQVFIAQTRYAEAEHAASTAVAALEQGGEGSLLAESLITHGIALARLGRGQAARSAFQRGIEAADTSGDLRSAARAYLVMIEELQQSLSSGEAAHCFLEADTRLHEPIDAGTYASLRTCARVVISGSSRANSTLDDFLIGGSLDDELRHLEGELILRALDQAKGSVTHAARRLGVTHQGLAYILENRQQSLQRARTPKKKRLRSIMKKL